MEARRIGLFGGTFDPIHFGHLNLAIEIQEKKSLDEIWMFPAHASPFRSDGGTLSEHRLRMVQLAVDPIPGFKVFDWEVKREPPSYTIDTVDFIFKSYPGENFFLILGADLLKDFQGWKNAKELAQKIPIFAGCRKADPIFPLPEMLQQFVELVETSILEISATNIRKRLNKKLYCGHLVPSKVLDYIYDNQLYFTDRS